MSTICYGQIVERKGTEKVKPVKVQEILQIKYSHKELTEEYKIGWASFYFEIDLNRLVGREYRGQEVSLKYSKVING